MPATLERPTQTNPTHATPTRDLLSKPFGPYRLTAGDHTEDEGLRQVKVTKLDGARIEVEGGLVMVIGREGAEVSLQGQAYRLYLDGRRITISELRPGLEIVLAQEVKHQPAGPPFRSSIELDKMHNAFDRRTGRELPNGRKFINVNGEAGGAERVENEGLRQRVAELEAELLAQREQEQPKAGQDQPPTPSQPPVAQPTQGQAPRAQQPKR